MFLNFDIINDAITQAKSQIEKAADGVLGIGQEGKEQAQSEPARSSTNAQVEAASSSNGKATQALTPATDNKDAAAGAGLPPQGPKVVKKVVKKVVRRVVKSSSTGDGTIRQSSAASDQLAATSSSLQAGSVTADAGSVVDPGETTYSASEAPDASPNVSRIQSITAAASHPAPLLELEPIQPQEQRQATDHDGQLQASGLSDELQEAGQAVQPAQLERPMDQNGHRAASSQQQWDTCSGWSDDLPGDNTADSTPLNSTHSNHSIQLQPHVSEPAGSLHAGLPADSRIAAVKQQRQPKGDGGTAVQPAEDESLQQEHSLPPSIAVPGELGALSHMELVALVQQLQEAVQARDTVLLYRAQRHSELEDITAQLQAKNEELALKAARISEQDWEEMRKEFEQRLAAAERKVYALTKERDALKRANEKLSDYTALIKEKDGIIQQVMSEGERLSSKQADMENSLKKLRTQIKELEADRERLTARLATEESSVEGLKRAKAKLERELAAAQEAAAAELEAMRTHNDSLLAKARADLAEAEERAHEAANAGLQRKLRDAESRSEALSETVVELREALDRQRQAADMREEMLKQDVSDLERRCQAAESRHQELAARLPEATRPLLRQIEAMQSASNAQAEAWATAEESLTNRIQDAEARAVAAAERERHATERAQVLQSRLAGVEAALSTSRAELKSVSEELDKAMHAQVVLKEQLAEAQHAAHLEAEHCRLVKLQLQQAEDKAAQALSAEHSMRVAAEADAATLRREYDRRVQELEGQLAEHTGGGGADRPGPEPPAMAAPGYRWVLLKEGEAAPAPTTPKARAPEQPAPQPPASWHIAQGEIAPHMQQPQSEFTTELLSSLQPSGGSGMPLASDLESMRATLRIRQGEVASLEAQVRALELTRDRLSEELVAAAQKAEEAANAVSGMAELQGELQDLRQRYSAAVELLGERDEQLEELRADLMDVKNLYKDQIEFMVMQLSQSHPAAADAAASAMGLLSQ